MNASSKPQTCVKGDPAVARLESISFAVVRECGRDILLLEPTEVDKAEFSYIEDMGDSKLFRLVTVCTAVSFDPTLTVLTEIKDRVASINLHIYIKGSIELGDFKVAVTNLTLVGLRERDGRDVAGEDFDTLAYKLASCETDSYRIVIGREVL